LGVKILNVTAGSPYYNPHIQRPAAYPPSDGYQPPEDPLVGVARQIQAARQIKAHAPPGLLVIGSAYSYLQEYLPHVAQAVVRSGWVDLVGIGRMVLSYPEFPSDVLARSQLEARRICRTFSDCTTAPRRGLVSGCYPLDPDYASRPEAGVLKALKKAGPAAPPTSDPP
jgi:NADPH2 dehydrogenase